MRTAFTLVEVLVVVGIVAILAGILFPVMSIAKDSAKSASCASNERQLGAAMAMYCHDYDGLWPIHDSSTKSLEAGRAGYTVEDWFSTSTPNWAKAIYSYTKGKEVYVCDSAAQWSVGANTGMPPLSFSYNGWNASVPQERAATPSSIVLLADARRKSSWAAANPAGVRRDHEFRYVSWINDTSRPPHRGGRYNVVYLDGHGKSLTFDAYWNHAYYDISPPPNTNPLPPQNQFYYP